MANTVTLTMVGDADQLNRTFDRVGESSKTMSDKVADSGKSFDDVGEKFDTLDTRAMGFRDTITGVQDSVKGFGAVLKGDFSGDALLTAGMGVGDLASGFSNFLVPGMKDAVTWLGKTKVGMAVATAAQWAWNVAMNANPIGLIIAGIVLLVGAFVLLWNKCDWFRNFWIGLWDGIKLVASKVVDWFKDIPGNLKKAFDGLVDIIVWPYKTAFNLIADAWNNTIGKLSWTVPDWVPLIGGKTISAPKLPKFHSGGVVPGAPGTEVMAILQAGERVIPVGQSNSEPATITGNTTINVTLNLDDLKRLNDLDDFLGMLRNNSRRGLVTAG